jgi:phospholipase C
VSTGSVSSTIYDHTSIIKTILARFCRNANGTVPDMGARVRAAQHLGGLLTEPSARPAIPRSSYQELVTQTQSWGDKLAAHETIPTRASLQAEASVTDFQQEFLALRQAVLAQRSSDVAAPPPS